jgi:hypothetical protein
MGAGCGNAVRGNFGFSFTYKIETFELIKQRLYYTFILSFWATVFAWVVGIPLGIYVARNRNKFGDRVANFVAFAGISCRAFSSRSGHETGADNRLVSRWRRAKRQLRKPVSIRENQRHRLAHDFAGAGVRARAAWPA